MDPDSADLVPECAFPSTVRVDGKCTGSYVGEGIVVTAAHCLGTLPPDYVSFTNTGATLDRFSVDVIECVAHPDGEWISIPFGNVHYAGVDLAYCELDPADSDYNRLDLVAIAPIMAPTGCIRDWLAHELYVENDCDPLYWKDHRGCTGWDNDYTYEYPGVLSTAVGMGKESPGGTVSGNKRSFNPTFYAQGDNSDGFFGGANQHYLGSPTQLVTSRREQWNGILIDGDGTLDGDSGGPLLYRLPDSTWRVIGDLNGDGASNMTADMPLNLYEAVPARLMWLENSTGRDLTPCHDLNADNEWEWHGACLGNLPTTLDQNGGTWATTCAGHSFGGQVCGGFGLAPPLDKITKQVPKPNHPWVGKTYLDTAIADAELLAVTGAFGSPASIPAIQDYLAGEVLEHGFHTFLAGVYPTGDLGAYIGAAATGDFDGDSSMEEVFGEADYDCGKGRVIVEDAADNKTYWSLDTAGVLGSNACGNYLGAAVAVGDFDGDGYDDLAMSTPGEPISSQTAAGAVHILYGSTSGLSESGDQVFNLDTTGIGGAAAEWDHFAEVLTTGDFNCDGYSDLAVGTPRKTINGVEEAGSVHVLYGSSGGLTSVSAQFYEGRIGVGDTAEVWDHFGSALAAGRFDNNSCWDLAIGVPDQDVSGQGDVGHVHVLHGDTAGLPSTATLTLVQGSGGVEGGTANGDDRFGARLEVEFGGTLDTLRILVPGESCTGSTELGWQTIPAASTGLGLDLSNDAIECELIHDGALLTADYGDLEQLTTLAAVRVARGTTP